MRSIRSKITTLTVAAILFSSVLVGAISIYSAKGSAESESEQIMSLVCQQKCNEINAYLNEVEDSVGTASRFVYDSLDVVELSDADVIGAMGSGRSLRTRERTPEQQTQFDAYLTEHVAEVEAVFDTIAENNSSVLSYYYRINPELSENVEGFWYLKRGELNFGQLEPTKIDDYHADDIAHVGWYYVPLERGRPSWLEPYENENLEETIVSYVIPIYKAGTFIGVVGMDVSYSSLVELLDGLEVLNAGYAFLTDEKGEILFHPQLETGALLGDVNEELQASNLDASGTELIVYRFNGQKKKAAWGTLSNGMRLIVSAPVSEINMGWYRLTARIVLAVLLVLAVFILIATALVRRITNPVELLASAAKQLAGGNYDVDLPDAGDDELGTLTQTFQNMASNLRVSIQDLNSKAYRDALTNVRNKGAFDMYVENLDEAIRSAGPDETPAFAVVMFDCNDLKKINDSFGHEKGDVYLQVACHLICNVYTHSPVFRVGGDEFVTILQQDDLKSHAELQKQFEESMQRINAAAEYPWERASIAVGIAFYDSRVDANVESVLRKADSRMYENKKEYKSRNATS